MSYFTISIFPSFFFSLSKSLRLSLSISLDLYTVNTLSLGSLYLLFFLYLFSLSLSFLTFLPERSPPYLALFSPFLSCSSSLFLFLSIVQPLLSLCLSFLRISLCLSSYLFRFLSSYLSLSFLTFLPELSPLLSRSVFSFPLLFFSSRSIYRPFVPILSFSLLPFFLYSISLLFLFVAVVVS